MSAARAAVEPAVALGGTKGSDCQPSRGPGGRRRCARRKHTSGRASPRLAHRLVTPLTTRSRSGTVGTQPARRAAPGSRHRQGQRPARDQRTGESSVGPISEAAWRGPRVHARNGSNVAAAPAGAAPERRVGGQRTVLVRTIEQPGVDLQRREVGSGAARRVVDSPCGTFSRRAVASSG